MSVLIFLQVVGADISVAWENNSKSYFGDAECFVFTLFPKEIKYSWSVGNPEFFAMLTDKSLTIGQG